VCVQKRPKKLYTSTVETVGNSLLFIKSSINEDIVSLEVSPQHGSALEESPYFIQGKQTLSAQEREKLSLSLSLCRAFSPSFVLITEKKSPKCIIHHKREQQ
jgi:hypothetical protein